jgi:hypothetical protein
VIVAINVCNVPVLHVQTANRWKAENLQQNLSPTEVCQHQQEQQLMPQCRRRVRSYNIKPSKLEVEGKH